MLKSRKERKERKGENKVVKDGSIEKWQNLCINCQSACV